MEHIFIEKHFHENYFIFSKSSWSLNFFSDSNGLNIPRDCFISLLGRNITEMFEGGLSGGEAEWGFKGDGLTGWRGRIILCLYTWLSRYLLVCEKIKELEQWKGYKILYIYKIKLVLLRRHTGYKRGKKVGGRALRLEQVSCSWVCFKSINGSFYV